MTRADLIASLGRLLEAIVGGLPTGDLLSAACRMTINGRTVHGSDLAALGVQRFAGLLNFADTQTRQSVMMGVAFVDERMAPVSIRALVDLTGRLAEVEMIHSSDRQGPFADAQELLSPDIVYAAPIPPSRRCDREALQAAADDYWEGLQNSDGDIPTFHYRCDKYDNGAKTTNTLRTLLSPDRTIHSCASALDHTRPARPLARERRYPVLDPELGIAASFVMVDFHPIPDSPRPDAGSFYMMGVFKVVDRQIRMIDEIREILPLGAQSGW